MIQQIILKKKIVVSKVIQNFADMRPYKVSVTLKFLGESGINSMQIKLGELTQKQKQNLMENQIQITLSAISETGTEQVSVNQDSISLLLLQTLLFQFNGFEIVDPSQAIGHLGFPLIGSTPFYNIETIQDLCQHVIFPFIEIDSGEHASLKGSISSKNSSRRDGINVEFQDNPQGLFLESLPISFLYESVD